VVAEQSKVEEKDKMFIEKVAGGVHVIVHY